MKNQAHVRRPTSPAILIFTVSVALLINYVDRGNLATAVPLIRDEFGMTSTRIGILLSAFYYSYVAFMIPAGWLTERFGPNRVLAGGVFIWSLATFLTGFATGFWTLLALRLLLGVGESVGFPSASLLFARGLKLTQIGFANGVLGFSYLVGPSVGTMLGGLLMPVFGWRAVFFVFGILSVIWILPLFRIRSLPAELLPAAEGHVGLDLADKPPFAGILRQPGLWGASLGHFAGNYNFYFILAWLPEYLVRERSFSMERMAYVAGIAYLINAVSSFLAGWAVSAWTRSGRSPNAFYKSIMAFGHIASMITMVCMVVLPIEGSIACLGVFQFAIGVASPGLYAIPQIIAGPLASGRWVGVQNACGNLAGVLAPAITGLLVDLTGTFSSAFMLSAAINILGLVGWVWMLPRIEPLDWSKISRPACAPTR